MAVLVYTAVGLDGDGEGYDHHYRQLTAEAEIGLRCGLRRDYERCECSGGGNGKFDPGIGTF